MIDANRYYLRRPDFVAVTTDGLLLIVDREGRCHEAPTAAVARWADLLQDLLAPMAGRELLARLAGLDPDEAEAARAVIDSGMLATATSAAALFELRDRLLGDNRGFHFEAGPPACPHLVVAMTGSVVAGLMAPTVLSLAHSGSAPGSTRSIAGTGFTCRTCTWPRPRAAYWPCRPRPTRSSGWHPVPARICCRC